MKTRVKFIWMASVILSFFSIEVRAESHCEKYRKQILDHGLVMILNIHGAQLRDATKTLDETLTFRLKMDDLGNCVNKHPTIDALALDHEPTIETAEGSYLGRVHTEGSYGSFTFAVPRDLAVVHPPIKIVGSLYPQQMLHTYHAVIATLLKKKGFETFEGVGGERFPALTGVEGALGKFIIDEIALGTASKNNALYQLHVVSRKTEIGQ